MKKHLTANALISLSVFLLTLTTKTAHACSVCFGGEDLKLAEGFTWGIAFLGSLPFLMGGALILYVFLATKKNSNKGKLSS